MNMEQLMEWEHLLVRRFGGMYCLHHHVRNVNQASNQEEQVAGKCNNISLSVFSNISSLNSKDSSKHPLSSC
jgi:hypothetical protein